VSTKPNILIAGYGLAPVLGITQLLGEGLTPDNLGLLTYDRPDNRFLTDFAIGRGIEVLTQPIKSPVTFNWMRNRRFEYLISLHYRDIIPAAVLDLFPNRSMNLHNGSLPYYRGCWSSSWEIINNEVIGGYAYHYMTPQLDDGRILAGGEVYILTDDTAFSLYHRKVRYSMDGFMMAFNRLKSGATGGPQIGTPGYYNRDVPYNGYIQAGWTGAQVDRFIRAMYFPPHKGAMLLLPDGRGVEVTSMAQYKELTCPTS